MPHLARRALLKTALLLVGASAAGIPSLAWSQSGAPRALSPRQFAILDEICALILPATDTPGAREAGVPPVIDALLADWGSAKTKAQFAELMDRIEQEARESLKTGLLQAAPEARLAFVERFDAAAFERRDRSYRRFKDLLLTTYYLSEAGATQELRFELAPGAWEPWTPAGPDTRAWAE